MGTIGGFKKDCIEKSNGRYWCIILGFCRPQEILVVEGRCCGVRCGKIQCSVTVSFTPSRRNSSNLSDFGGPMSLQDSTEHEKPQPSGLKKLEVFWRFEKDLIEKSNGRY